MARPTRPSAVKRASTLKVRVLVAQRALLYPCAPLSAAAVGGVRVVAFVGGGFMTRALAARGLSNGLSSDILSHVTDIHATVLALALLCALRLFNEINIRAGWGPTEEANHIYRAT